MKFRLIPFKQSFINYIITFIINLYTTKSLHQNMPSCERGFSTSIWRRTFGVYVKINNVLQIILDGKMIIQLC